MSNIACLHMFDLSNNVVSARGNKLWPPRVLLPRWLVIAGPPAMTASLFLAHIFSFSTLKYWGMITWKRARAGGNQSSASPLLLWTGQDQGTGHYSWQLYPTSGNWNHGSRNHSIFQGIFRKDLRARIFVKLFHRLAIGSYLGDVLLSGSFFLTWVLQPLI